MTICGPSGSQLIHAMFFYMCHPRCVLHVYNAYVCLNVSNFQQIFCLLH